MRISKKELNRITSKFAKTDKCWEWKSTLNSGYGMIYFRGKSIGAHRLVYRVLVGPIPKGLELDHLCRNRKCVNPAHLEPVTGKENRLRSESPCAKNARKTHCKRGHLLQPPNLTWCSRPGGRQCRECLNMFQRNYWRKKAARKRLLRSTP